MYYTIYKTTNLLNNKIYVGLHITDNLEDDYLGSGTLLKRAVNKYGEINFKREILHILNTREEMASKEAEIVNEEFIARTDTYNLALGGFGGGYPCSQETKDKLSAINMGNKHTIEAKDKISKAHTGRIVTKETRDKLSKANTGKKHTQETKDKISKISSSRSDITRQKMADAKLGTDRTQETKDKISQTLKGQYTGEQSSMFKGWYDTPNGRFTSAKAAGDSFSCHGTTINNRCHSTKPKWGEWRFIPK